MAKTSNRVPSWIILLGAFIVSGLLALMIGSWVMGVYNGLVQEEGNVQNGWLR
jgi:hypothetical protein